MSIHAVDKECKFVNGRLVITLESDNMSDLLENGVIKFAQQEAARFGLPAGKITAHDAPEPVDENGNPANGYEGLRKLADNPNPRYRKKVYLVA